VKQEGKPLSALLRCGLLALFACFAMPALCVTVDELRAQGRLQIDSAVSPTGQLVPGQKTLLTLEIATDRWFGGGTRIAIPEVPGLVILQTEQFASNASENRNGQSWVIQRWNLDIYPQRAGEFSIPPIELSLTVNAGASENVEGKLYSPPTAFSVVIPPALEQAQDWVASPRFSVSQQFDRSLEGLQPGDAFERTIAFEADDVMAMMLPEVAVQKIPGLGVYPSPPVLANNNNRGQSLARRSQSISYIVEAQGQYQLPAMEFFWWDTTSGSLQLLSLPQTSITVGAGVPQDEKPAQPRSARIWLLVAAGVFIAGALVWLTHQMWRWLPLARLKAALLALRQRLQAIRQPALPEHLNPGSNAARKTASG
jgi:hypothetical protein